MFEKYIKEKERFLIDMFVEDGHNNQLLKDLVTDYNNQKSSKSNYQNNIEN